MLQKKLKIINKLGLHARAAAKLVALTSKFAASITIKSEQREIDGKSIMSVMMLAASQGTILEVITNGQDEQELLKAVEELIINKFNEDE